MSDKENKAVEKIEFSFNTFDNQEKTLTSIVSVVKKESLLLECKFTLEKQYLDIITESKILELQKQVKIDGFRPGKTPLAIIKKRYDKNIKEEVLKFVLDKTSSEFISLQKLKVSDTSINILTFDDTKLEYIIKFELLPEIKIPDFKKINIENPKLKLQKKDIDAALKKILENNKDFKEKSKTYKAKEGDVVVIDFVGKIDNKEFKGGSAENYELTIGSKSFIDDFEEQLLGSKINDEKIVKVNFPQNYNQKEFAGKPAVFEVKIKKILSGSLPELNDQFAAKFNLKDLAELENKVKEQLEKDFYNIADMKKKKTLFDVLEKECNFDVPQAMMKKEFDAILHNHMTNNAKNIKDDEKAKKEYESLAKRRVKLGLLLAEISKIEKTEVNEQDIKSAIQKQMELYPNDHAAIIDYYTKNPSAIEQIKGSILEDKVVAQVMQEVNLLDKECSLEEIRKTLET